VIVDDRVIGTVSRDKMHVGDSAITSTPHHLFRFDIVTWEALAFPARCNNSEVR
jgi:hypothetical protein